MSKVNVVIVIEGGIVQNVICNEEINVAIIDHDNDGIDNEELTTLTDKDGSTFESYVYTNNNLVEIDKDNFLFNQIKDLS